MILDREPDYDALEDIKQEDPLLSGEEHDLLTSEFDDEVMQDASYDQMESNRELRSQKAAPKGPPRL